MTTEYTETQPSFLMLVGIAGAGKSTISKEIMENRDDITYLSSDELRIELYGDVNDQDHNGQVFQEMGKRAVQAIKDGKHVIYDATNISRKKRKGILQQLPKDTSKQAFVVMTEYKTALEQNDERERTVDKYVIDRMYKNMQIPVYNEGWDKIIYHTGFIDEYPQQFVDALRAEVLLNRDGYELMGFLATYFEEFFGVYDMPQDSKWHTLSVSRHIYYVYKYILDNYETEDEKEKEIMLWTGLLHDIGKHFTKTFENRKRQIGKHAHFYGHEYVSSQMAIPFLYKLGYDDDFVYQVSTLCQFHMYLLDEKANKEKLKKLVGDKMFNQLEFIRDADNQAH